MITIDTIIYYLTDISLQITQICYMAIRKTQPWSNQSISNSITSSIAECISQISSLSASTGQYIDKAKLDNSYVSGSVRESLESSRHICEEIMSILTSDKRVLSMEVRSSEELLLVLDSLYELASKLVMVRGDIQNVLVNTPS